MRFESWARRISALEAQGSAASWRHLEVFSQAAAQIARSGFEEQALLNLGLGNDFGNTAGPRRR